MHRRSVPYLTPRRLKMMLAATGGAAAVIPAVLAAAAVPAQARPTAPTAAPTDPPPVTVLTQGGDNHNRDIFIAPFGDTSTYANGPEIINNAGGNLPRQGGVEVNS